MCVNTLQEASNPKEDAAYFESLSTFVSKVRGEHFSWEQARDMTFKDIAKNVEMYHAMLQRLFKQGADDAESAAHAELVELLALKVSGGVALASSLTRMHWAQCGMDMLTLRTDHTIRSLEGVC